MAAAAGHGRATPLFFPLLPQNPTATIKIAGGLLCDMKYLCKFAVAGRLAEAPIWGQAERVVVNILKKAFIRADS